LAGVTTHAAKALGLGDRGQIKVGQRADLALWAVNQPAELCYWLGMQPLAARWLGGQLTTIPAPAGA
jgi:imidazolonepropionase